jgi:multicomponent Na+:H+ antiporter subunit D
MAGAENLLVLGPIIIPLLGAAICLLLSHNNDLQRRVAFLVGLAASLTSIAVMMANFEAGTAGVQIYRLGGWVTPFGIVLVADKLAALFCVMSSLVIAAGLLYCLQCHDHSLNYPVFMPAFLCMGAGLNGSFYTGDIFTFFVFVELMVMASVVMVAISDSPLGLEAAIKYIFISGMGSLLLLLGTAGLYTTFGTLAMAQISHAFFTGEDPFLAVPATVMFIIAFLIKSAVVPFHFWQPDFHTTAPTPVSGMLSSVVVKVGIYGIIRNSTGYLPAYLGSETSLVENILIVLGVVGIFFGGLTALRTWNAKRMLAYSTLGQIGFILVAIGWGSQAALGAAIIYIFNHAFIKSALLLLTGVIASHNEKHSADLKDLAGTGRGLSFLSLLYLVGGLALAGIPPFNGFISKVALVRGGAEVNSWFILGLVISGGLLTIIYMTRTWQWIFQQPPSEAVKPNPHGSDSPLAPALLIGACVLLGLFASPLVNLSEDAAAQLTNPRIYFCAVLEQADLPEGSPDCSSASTRIDTAFAGSISEAEALERE